MLILYYITALNNLKPLLCVISNDYLTLNCYEHVSMSTGPEFSSLVESIILIKNDPYGLKFSSAAFLQWLDETLTQLDHEWTSDYLHKSWHPYNLLQLDGIPYYQEHRHFGPNMTLQPKQEAFIQGDWHDFTEERRNPFQGTHQSRVGILCLTIILLMLIMQGISWYTTFVICLQRIPFRVQISFRCFIPITFKGKV